MRPNGRHVVGSGSANWRTQQRLPIGNNQVFQYPAQFHFVLRFNGGGRSSRL